MLITKANYDHIFYLFESKTCAMKRKLEDKTKKKIEGKL